MKHRQTLAIVACMAWFLALGRAQAAGQLVTKADLSPEESQEYVELLAELQNELDAAYPSLAQTFEQAPMLHQTEKYDDLSVVIQRWLLTQSSVHATEVTRGLFVTYPPRVRVDLQVELSNQKAGEAGEEFTLPIQVELLH